MTVAAIACGAVSGVGTSAPNGFWPVGETARAAGCTGSRYMRAHAKTALPDASTCDPSCQGLRFDSMMHVPSEWR